MLPYDLARLTPLTDELDEWRMRLDYRGPLPRAWVGRLRRDLEAEAIAASTSMEGVPVTIEEVRRILVGDRPPEVTPEDAALVSGYREAMSFVLRRADDPAFGWDPELLISLHDRILAGNWAAGAARFRDGPAYVVNSQTGELVFEPPPDNEIPTLVEQACDQMDANSDHPAIRSAWIHVAVAGMHPFKDGNGRSARVVASLAMYRGGFKLPEFTSLEEWWGHHLSEYYAAFECLGRRFDADSDVTPFVETHIRAQLHQVRALDLRERVQRRIWISLEHVASDGGLEQRIVNALWDAFFGREVTRGYYRPLADVSPQTASNDLAGAVRAQLLRAEGRGRARRYVATPHLYEAIADILNISGIRGSQVDEARARIVQETTMRATRETPAITLAD